MSNDLFVFENGFFPNNCPLCGKSNYITPTTLVNEIDLDELAVEIGTQLANHLNPITEEIETLSAKIQQLKEWKDQRLALERKIGWIYVKVWQEKSWLCVKPGKTGDIEKREKQYDDHDYILNLCAPIPIKLLNDYEDYLKKVLFDFLIPTLLNYRIHRLEKKLGEDFKHIQIKDGFAPGRKEYYRLFIDELSIEFDFLIVGLRTFFGGLVHPYSPIEYDKWIEIIENLNSEDAQKNIFDELENDME